MRPAAALKLTLSSAWNLPNDLLSPRASITAPIGDLARSGFVAVAVGATLGGFEQVGGAEPKAVDCCQDLRPLIFQELLPFVLHQDPARAFGNEHAPTAPLLDQLLVDQLLVALEDRQRIELVFGRYVAHRRQRIAVLQHTLEDHRDHAIPELPIDRLTVIPVRIHAAAFSVHCAGRLANYCTRTARGDRLRAGDSPLLLLCVSRSAKVETRGAVTVMLPSCAISRTRFASTTIEPASASRIIGAVTSS